MTEMAEWDFFPEKKSQAGEGMVSPFKGLARFKGTICSFYRVKRANFSNRPNSALRRSYELIFGQHAEKIIS